MFPTIFSTVFYNFTLLLLMVGFWNIYNNLLDNINIPIMFDEFLKK